jgi:probable phosphoglycerate mutase
VKLYLVRHGETGSNLMGALDTAVPGADLTDTGIAQATRLIERFSDIDVDALFTSTLVRTHQTIEPLSAALGLTPTVLDGLREISAGSFEMATDEESVLGYMAAVGSWIMGDTSVRMPGSETGDEFLARYDGAVKTIVASGAETAILVSHGAAIRTWVGHRCDLTDWDGAAFQSLPNTGAIELEGTIDDWKILSWSQRPADELDPYRKS